eukprot:1557994-Rhodomonas_salina.1
MEAGMGVWEEGVLEGRGAPRSIGTHVSIEEHRADRRQSYGGICSTKERVEQYRASSALQSLLPRAPLAPAGPSASPLPRTPCVLALPGTTIRYVSTGHCVVWA